MEAYSNCRQFNCVPPIVEQSEYHMFCREKCELYLPEMYNKIGVGLMAWGPLSMALGDAQNGERLLFPKNSFKTKSHSYSWTEDEINKNVRSKWIKSNNAMLIWNMIYLISFSFLGAHRASIGPKNEWMRHANKAIKCVICVRWQRNWAAVQRNYRLHGHWNMNQFNAFW